MDAENTRAVVGDNRAPNYAQQITEQMRRDYAATEESVAGLLEEARALPAEVNDDETMGTFARLIKKFRDVSKRIEAFHAAEKEPHLRAGQAVDQYFFSLWDKCVRRNRQNKPGAADILQARLDDYNQRKLRAEQERRRREAEEQERLAREAQEKAERERREAEEARLAAERARKVETREQKGAAATVAENAASGSKIDAAIATDRAQEAHIATLARPADLVRTRVDEGPLVTMGIEPYAEIVDRALLDKEKLWPFLKEDALALALRSWAKTTGHNISMAGASIGKRQKSVVR